MFLPCFVCQIHKRHRMQLPIWFCHSTQTTLEANAFLAFCCTLIYLCIFYVNFRLFIFVMQTIFPIFWNTIHSSAGIEPTYFARCYSMTTYLTTCYNVLCMCCLHTMFSLDNWHEPYPFQLPCQSFYGNHFFLSILRSWKLKIFHNIFTLDSGMASLEKLKMTIFYTKLDHFNMKDVHKILMWIAAKIFKNAAQVQCFNKISPKTHLNFTELPSNSTTISVS